MENAINAFDRGRQQGAKINNNHLAQKKKVEKYQKHDQIWNKPTMKNCKKKDFRQGKANGGKKQNKNNQEQTRRTNIYVKRIQLGYQEILRIKVELDNFDTDGLKEENDKMLGFYMKGNWCI